MCGNTCHDYVPWHSHTLNFLGLQQGSEIPTVDTDTTIKTKAVAKTKTTRGSPGSERFHDAMIREPPNPFSSNSPMLYLAIFAVFICSIMNGYEASLFNSLLETPNFKDYFRVKNSGIWAGIVSSMYEIGSFTAFPFIGPALDTFGRRFGLFTGITIIFIGTIVQGTTMDTAKVGQYMGGRFLLGFGIAIAASAGPTYIVELSHPAYRGMITALYNTFWYAPCRSSDTRMCGSLT